MMWMGRGGRRWERCISRVSYELGGTVLFVNNLLELQQIIVKKGFQAKKVRYWLVTDVNALSRILLFSCW